MICRHMRAQCNDLAAGTKPEGEALKYARRKRAAQHVRRRLVTHPPTGSRGRLALYRSHFVALLLVTSTDAAKTLLRSRGQVSKKLERIDSVELSSPGGCDGWSSTDSEYSHPGQLDRALASQDGRHSSGISPLLR